MATYLQLVRRDLKIGAIGKEEQLAWEGPVGLGTDRTLTSGFAPRDLDTIYLVSTLPGRQLPSLDARIVVNSRKPAYPTRVNALSQAKGTVFAAGKESSWLPMLNAMPILQRLQARRGTGWGPVLARAADNRGLAMSNAQRLLGLRTIRRLDDRSESKLQAWVAKRLTQPVFISYRSRDGSQLAIEAALFFAGSGVPVWFDQWSLSIRLDDLDWTHADEQLLENIPRAMAGCAAVVVVETPEYGTTEWTRRELAWAANSSIVRISNDRAGWTAALTQISSIRAV